MAVAPGLKQHWPDILVCDSGGECHKAQQSLSARGIESRHVQEEASDGGLCAWDTRVRGVFSAPFAGTETDGATDAGCAAVASHLRCSGGCDGCIGLAPSGWGRSGHEGGKPNQLDGQEHRHPGVCLRSTWERTSGAGNKGREGKRDHAPNVFHAEAGYLVVFNRDFSDFNG